MAVLSVHGPSIIHTSPGIPTELGSSRRLLNTTFKECKLNILSNNGTSHNYPFDYSIYPFIFRTTPYSGLGSLGSLSRFNNYLNRRLSDFKVPGWIMHTRYHSRVTKVAVIF